MRLVDRDRVGDRERKLAPGACGLALGEVAERSKDRNNVSRNRIVKATGTAVPLHAHQKKARRLLARIFNARRPHNVVDAPNCAVDQACFGPEILQEHDARADAKRDVVVEIAGIATCHGLSTNAGVDGLDIENRSIKPLQMNLVVLHDAVVGRIDAHSVVKARNFGRPQS